MKHEKSKINVYIKIMYKEPLLIFYTFGKYYSNLKVLVKYREFNVNKFLCFFFFKKKKKKKSINKEK